MQEIINRQVTNNKNYSQIAEYVHTINNTDKNCEIINYNNYVVFPIATHLPLIKF